MNTTKPTFANSKEIVENNIEIVKAIAVFLVMAFLVLVAGLKWLAKESYQSGVNARIAMFPPSALSPEDYHDVLMTTRPRWLVWVENLRKSMVKRTERLRESAKKQRSK